MPTPHPVIGRITTCYAEEVKGLWGVRVKILLILEDRDGRGTYAAHQSDEELTQAGGIAPHHLALVIPVAEREQRLELRPATVRVPALACFAHLATALYPEGVHLRDARALKDALLRWCAQPHALLPWRAPCRAILLAPIEQGLDGLDRALAPEIETRHVTTTRDALAWATQWPADAVLVVYLRPKDHTALEALNLFRTEHSAMHRILIARALVPETHAQDGLVQGILY